LELFFNNISPKAFAFRGGEDSIWGQEVIMRQQAVYQIVASSGSGKSTLVSILSGLRNDYSGALKIGATDTSSYGSKAWSLWRSKHASFVFQDLRLFPELTAMENIILTSELNANKISVASITTMAEQLGITAKLPVVLKKLSYGQMQRVAIVRALSRDYDWLILDEPFSHLDVANAEVAWSMILDDARSKNAGIIITSLDPYPFIHPYKVFKL
jgi:ABC-type lipoprotein export system ATPase subunit